MPLREKRKQRYNILTQAYEFFIRSIRGVEESLLEAMIGILSSFEITDGFIDTNDVNTRKVVKVAKVIDDVLKRERYDGYVKQFTGNFDKIDKLSRELLAAENGIDLKELNKKITTNDEKHDYINQILNGLITKEARAAQLDIPLKRLMYRHATTGVNIRKAEKELERFLLGKNGGELAKRARFYTIESLNRFDGLLQTKFMQKYDAKVFVFQNPLIKTSVENCIQMVEGDGVLGRLAIAPRTFLVEDIPEIIRVSKKEGWMPDSTNVENYFIMRNHFGCRHVISCRLRTDEWIEQKKKERSARNK